VGAAAGQAMGAGRPECAAAAGTMGAPPG